MSQCEKFRNTPIVWNKNRPDYKRTPGSVTVVTLFSENMDETSEILDAID